LLFSLFPELIFSKTILPYEISLSFLLFMPVGYGLAIFRYRLLTLDRYVNRTATKSLLVLIIVSLYGFIYLAAPQLVPIKMSEVLLSGFVVIFLLIFTYQPLSLFLQRFVDRILYGGWYDDREIIRNVNLTLHESQADPNEIVNSLCQALQKTLQLEYVNFLFPNGNLFTTYDMGDLTYLGQQTLQTDGVISIFSRLSQMSEYGFGDARLMNKGTATDQQIFGDHPQLWLLLKNQTDNLGLLILGDRRGGEFEQLDLNTLAVVTRQASYALENATLLAQVSQQTRKVQALNNQMAEAREEERKRLARELHDQILQSLYGLNFHIYKIKPHLSPDYQSEVDLIHNEIQGTADHVRAICSDLRPPALDSQGLIPATRDYLRNLKKVTGLQIIFSSDGDETQALPSAVSITLYRILQECLANVQKHACANNVLVHLSIEKSWLSMKVSDDGKGFFLPKNFEQFTKSEHYGLAGIQERLNSVGGQLDIISSPDQGCEVRVKVPFQLPLNEAAFLQENNNDYSGDYRR
jgi:signal transduction histidine kinase